MAVKMTMDTKTVVKEETKEERDKRLGADEKKARELYKSFNEKFPESDGYKITVSQWESVGEHIIF